MSAVVLSGKGGTAKTLWQMMLAAEASRAGIATLLVDADPERNLSNHFGISQHSTGLGSVLEDASINFWGKPDSGAKRLDEEIVETRWADVHLLPAGASLARVGNIGVANTWLLREIATVAGVLNRYELVLIDTGGRTGSLEALAMYMADVAYTPIVPTIDAVRKAMEARNRVERIQKAHPLKWCGVVLSGSTVAIASMNQSGRGFTRNLATRSALRYRGAPSSMRSFTPVTGSAIASTAPRPTSHQSFASSSNATSWVVIIRRPTFKWSGGGVCGASSSKSSRRVRPHPHGQIRVRHWAVLIGHQRALLMSAHGQFQLSIDTTSHRCSISALAGCIS